MGVQAVGETLKNIELDLEPKADRPNAFQKSKSTVREVLLLLFARHRFGLTAREISTFTALRA
jgi:hypothetical protein